MLAFRVLGDGEDAELDPEVLRDRLDIGMIADDEGDLTAEFARPVTQQKIVETMVLLGAEDRHLLHVSRIGDPPVHVHALRDFCDGILESGAVYQRIARVEVDALEEKFGVRIRMLVGIEEVGPVAVENLGQGGDEATPIGTGDEKRGGFGLSVDGVGS